MSLAQLSWSNKVEFNVPCIVNTETTLKLYPAFKS